MSDNLLEGKVAIVTGAGRGIGRTIALSLATNGAKVVVFGRRKSRLEKAIKEIGDNAISIQGDITQEKDIKGLITMYGGAASHMAIRCAELQLPAAIGCGELLYNTFNERDRIQLDCKNKKIIMLS